MQSRVAGSTRVNRVLKTAVAVVIGIAFLVLVIGGCTSMTAVPTDDIAPGDRVSITTVNGERFEFLVSGVGGGTVRGDSIAIGFGEISTAHIVAFAPGRTLALVGGAVALVYVIGAYQAFDDIIDALDK